MGKPSAGLMKVKAEIWFSLVFEILRDWFFESSKNI